MESAWGTRMPEELQRFLDGDHGLQSIVELVACYLRLLEEKENRMVEMKKLFWDEIEEIFYELGLEKQYGKPTKNWREGGMKKERLAQVVVDREYPQDLLEQALVQAGIDVARIQRYRTMHIRRAVV